MRLHFGVAAGERGREPADIHQQGSQRLADFVMQLARDGAPFGLLRVYEARRELLQRVLAAREFHVAGAGLPIEPHDVCHATQHQQ